MMPIRLPVTRRRRWVQITALGASEVPEVKMSAQRVSGSGSRPRSSSPIGAERGIEVVAERPVRVVAVGEATAGRAPVAGRRRSGRACATCRGSVITRPQWVCVGVTKQMLAAAGVVEPDDGGADEGGATEREEVVGGVVEQDPDVRGLVEGPGGARNRFAKRRHSRPYSAWVQARSSNLIAGREARSGSVALARRSAAAFGAGIGASPGAGTVRLRREPPEPDTVVRLPTAVPAGPWSEKLESDRRGRHDRHATRAPWPRADAARRARRPGRRPGRCSVDSPPMEDRRHPRPVSRDDRPHRR